MSPGLCPRLATTPANARADDRPGGEHGRGVLHAGLAPARARPALRRGRASRPRAPSAPRRRARRASSGALTDACAFSHVRLRLVDFRRAAPRRRSCSDGISKRTSRSPGFTRSPSAFGSSTMRAGSGAVITQSAPGAAVDDAGGGHDAFERLRRERERRDRRRRVRLDFFDRGLRAAGRQQRARHANRQSPVVRLHLSGVPIARSRSASAS